MHIAHCQPSRLNQEMGNLLNDMNTSHGTLSTQLTDMRMDHKDGTLKSDKLDQFLGTLLWFEQHFQLIWSRPDPATVKVPNQVPKNTICQGYMQVKHYIFRKSMFVLHWHRWIWGFPWSSQPVGKWVWQRLADSSHGGNQCWWWRWWETMATRTYWLQPAGPNMPEYIVSVHLYVHLCPVMCLLPCLNPQIWKEPWVQDTQVECIYNAN